MDSFELNKILGAVLATMVVITAVRLVADAIYNPGSTANLAGPDIAAGAPAASQKAEPEVPLAQLIKNASLERGQRVSKKCVSCHTFNKGGPNRIGPNLWGIVNRPMASESGFGYSSELKKQKGKWDFKALNDFLHKPRQYLPGTLMSFAGLRKPKDRGAILLYLRSLSDSPAKLPN